MAELQFQTVHFDSLPSTNLEVARRAQEGAAEGLCIVAGEQTAGRGRLGREWLSPRGAGIYCSTLLRPQFEQKLWPLITLMSAVVVNETLAEACGLKTDIKWPNDILHEGRKLCGILAEIVETPGGRAVVVGIGINLTNDSFPTELANVATSVAAATGREPVLDLVLEKLQRSFASWYRKLNQHQGANEIILAWSQRSSYANGKRVRVTDSGTHVDGMTRGLDLEGGLRLETETGEIKIIRAGDVTVRPLAAN